MRTRPKSAGRSPNVEIFDFELDGRDLKEIEPLTGNGRQISPSWAPAWDVA